MLRMTHVIKPWKESGALNAHINLYGFWNQGIFLTKSGDLGLVLKVRGVDYESLDQKAQEYAVKRLEAAMKVFGPGFHVYQYLFKTSRPTIPFQTYGDPIVNAAVEQRKEFFAQKLDCLFDVEIFYAVLIEGARSKTGITAALAQILFDPAAAMGELKAQFSNDKMKVLLREQIEADLLKLEQRTQSFSRQVADFVQIEVLQQDECFCFLRRKGSSAVLRFSSDGEFGAIRCHALTIGRYPFQHSPEWPLPSWHNLRCPDRVDQGLTVKEMRERPRLRNGRSRTPLRSAG